MSSEHHADLRGTRVLVVDDDADHREMLAMTLTHYGARVTTARSAAEALRAMEKELPQVLISDIGLPDEDGFSLLKRVRALGASRGEHVPAIAITGRDRQEAPAPGGFEVQLQKPVAIEAVLAAITRLVGA